MGVFFNDFRGADVQGRFPQYLNVDSPMSVPFTFPTVEDGDIAYLFLRDEPSPDVTWTGPDFEQMLSTPGSNEAFVYRHVCEAADSGTTITLVPGVGPLITTPPSGLLAVWGSVNIEADELPETERWLIDSVGEVNDTSPLVYNEDILAGFPIIPPDPERFKEDGITYWEMQNAVIRDYDDAGVSEDPVDPAITPDVGLDVLDTYTTYFMSNGVYAVGLPSGSLKTKTDLLGTYSPDVTVTTDEAAYSPQTPPAHGTAYSVASALRWVVIFEYDPDYVVPADTSLPAELDLRLLKLDGDALPYRVSSATLGLKGPGRGRPS